MCSIRNAVLLGGTVIINFLAGCQANVPAGVERMNTTPLVVDDAMQRRDWERSISFYANGDTIAGGTGYMFQTHETIPAGWRRVADPIMTCVNIGLLPIGLFVNSPFKSQVYQGVIIPPTYTANPPLP